MTGTKSFRNPADRGGLPLVLILTALQNEFSSVYGHLENCFEDVDPHGTVYECGDFFAPGQSWKVALAETGPGNLTAMSFGLLAINHFNPDLVLFVGIAGGLKSDTEIGDVVASVQIDYYEGGKETDEGYFARPRTLEIHPGLVQRAKAVARKTDWLKRLDLTGLPRIPKAITGVIVAGEILVAAKKSHTYSVIRSHYNDALATEMEGYGAASAAFHLGRPCLIIRAISDLIDNKDATDQVGSQEFACNSAASFAFEVLANYAISSPPANVTPGSSHGTQPNESQNEPRPTGTSVKTWLLALDSSDLQSIRDRKSKIELHLRELCSDPSLCILEIAAGSVLLTISSSEAAFLRLSSRVLARAVEEILGNKVLAIADERLRADNLVDLFQDASKSLLSWPTTLGGDHWIARKEVHRIEHTVRSQGSSFSVLLGAPGTGKSALLARLCRDLLCQGVSILAIKADSLPVNINNQASLGAYLGFECEPSAAIRLLAAKQKVVVVIDQLDALSALVDLQSERLNTLLNLIHQIAGLNNVHIICSSRTFEYHHDTRLISTQADEIALELPEWDEIVPLLVKYDANAKDWPQRFQEILRVPQYLKTFLCLCEGTREVQIYQSYQRMLEEMWKDAISSGPLGTSDFLDRLASSLSESETLWEPISKYDSDAHFINHLLGSGILILSDSTTSVGFSHQTLFDFGRSRAFAKGTERLVDFVLRRQDALFVRPKLWSSLHYLRESSRVAYLKELRGLWGNPSTRLHIQSLLLEFLGQVAAPDETEVNLFLTRMKDGSFTSRALTAAAGNPDWFEPIVDNFLPILMQRQATEAWPAVHYLHRAMPFANEKVLQLIEKIWLPNADYDVHTWRVLDGAGEWGEHHVSFATCILRRTNIHTFSVMSIAESLAHTRPDLSIELVAVILQRQLAAAQQEASLKVVPPPASDDWEEQFTWALVNDSRAVIATVLEETSTFYNLPELAGIAGGVFVKKLWPWLIELLNGIANPEPPSNSYRNEKGVSTVFDDEDNGGRYPIPSAFIAAIRAFAQESPSDFLVFVDTWKSSDLMFVQRLLALGLKELATTHSDEVLKFLLEDTRRFALGTHRDLHGDTKEVVRVLSGSLSPDQFQTLESAILRWKFYSETSEMKPENRLDRLKWNRERRLKLLRTLPKERLSVETRRLLAEEERAFPYIKDWDSKIEGGFVGSPMSSTQMASARDEDILALFDELPDTTEWDNPKGFMRGGSIQASRALADMAKSDPDKALRVIRQLPHNAQRPAGYVIDAISSIDKDYNSTLFSVIVNFNDAGFSSSEFRTSVANALSRLAGKYNGLPEKMLEILRDWLETNWGISEDSDEQKDEEPKKEYAESMLWSGRGISIIPQGSYTVLEALTRAYLSSDPPRDGEWLTMVRDHIQRRDSVRTWEAFSHHLRYLPKLGREATEETLTLLFNRFPGLRFRNDGLSLIGYSLRVLGKESFHTLVAPLKGTSGRALGPQAYGELLMLRSFLIPDDERASHELQQIRQTEAGDDRNLGAQQLGVAFAAAHLWVEVPRRKTLTDVLIDLVPLLGAAIAPALDVLFRGSDRLFADDDTVRILEGLMANPDVLTHLDKQYFIDRIQDLIPIEPELVYRVADLSVQLGGKELADLSTSWSSRASDLVNIAITLQRFDGDIRAQGLSLFESLLAIDASGARETLVELDGRPLSHTQRRQRKRLPRRRR